ncbi:hypothetical protein BDZ91DRAFT_375756 [Kalaharituber pfeilii]|nr:hypothetical protein BDZ91DRAFT_375756 [Kalaharituber pfeilii]
MAITGHIFDVSLFTTHSWVHLKNGLLLYIVCLGHLAFSSLLLFSPLVTISLRAARWLVDRLGGEYYSFFFLSSYFFIGKYHTLEFIASYFSYFFILISMSYLIPFISPFILRGAHENMWCALVGYLVTLNCYCFVVGWSVTGVLWLGFRVL